MALLAAAILSGCRKREIIHPEPTDEGGVVLSSSINMADPARTLQLIRGFYQIEENSWRWTAGRFAVTLRIPEEARKTGKCRLIMKLAAPASAIDRLGPMRMSATMGQNRALPSLEMATAGSYTYEANLPSDVLRQETATVDFTLDKHLAPGTLDPRELGVIVASVELVAQN